MLGSWDVNISANSMPQKVATAVADMNNRVGCEYEPIAYIGSQEVNGTLHAVVVKQKVILGEDKVNVNLVKFLETKDGIAEISNDILVSGGSPLGGINIDPKFGEDIPKEAIEAFNEAFRIYVGMRINPIILVYSQVAKGTSYVFLAEATTVTVEKEKMAFLVKVNSLEQRGVLINILSSKEELAENGRLGYAFTW